MNINKTTVKKCPDGYTLAPDQSNCIKAGGPKDSTAKDMQAADDKEKAKGITSSTFGAPLTTSINCPEGTEKIGERCYYPCEGNAETVGINCNPRCPKQGLDVGGNMCQFFGPTKIGVFPKDPTYTRRSIGIKPVSVGNETVKTTFGAPLTIKAMPPGQVGGMIGPGNKDMGAKVEVVGQGLSQNLLPASNNTMFGNIAVKEGGAPSPYAKMAEKAPEGAPPSQYGAAKPPTGPPAAPGTYGTAKPLTDPAPGGAYGTAKPLTDPAPGGAYGAAKIAEKGPAPPAELQNAMIGAKILGVNIPKPMEPIKGLPPGQVGGMIGGKIGVDLPKPMEPPKVSGAVMMEQIKKGEMPTGIAKSVPPAEYGVAKGPAPMMKEDAVKAMAPGQSGGMIGGAGKEMGGKIEAIGQGLAAPERNAPDIKKMLEDKKENLPEAIAKKVDPEVKKIVDSFGKPAPSEVEQKKMEAMKAMGVAPPKDAKDMEDLRKGIYRPDGKEIPGTALFESFKKDLSAFASMLMKLVGGSQSGYTSGEMFGSTNSLILIALVVAIVFASRR